MKPKKCSFRSCKNETKTKYCSEECRVFATYKTIPKLKKYIWKLYSEYIRRNYADDAGYVQCYTCPKRELWNSGKIHAGHFMHGDNPGTWTNDKNVKPQCGFVCNISKSGNREVYALRLELEYGFGIIQELDKAFWNPPTTWSIVPLRQEYRRVANLLSCLIQPSS